MDLSVVIPTYRRPDLLRTCLASLATQDLDLHRFEVVVVDDGSADATGDVCADAARHGYELVPLVQAQNGGPAAARNRGIEAARGELVLFLDDDVAATPSLLSTHVALHAGTRDPKLGVLGKVEWDASVPTTPFMRWLDRSGLQFGYDTWLREGPVDPPYAAFYTANLSLPRALLVEAGGFDARFPYAAFEDIELAFRLAAGGFHLDYRPQALAFHTRAMDLEGFCARMERVGESAELMRRAAPEFPLDDAELRAGQVGRVGRWRRRLAAARGDDVARNRWYWAEVRAAYARGRARAAG